MDDKRLLIIEIGSCFNCYYRSGPICTYDSDDGKVIDESVINANWKNIPDWCPLPKVTENPDS